MAKRKRNNVQAAPVSKKQVSTTGIRTPPQESTTEPTNVQSVVPPEDVEITIETLQALKEYPNVLKSKSCKDLRTAVFDFRQACTTGQNAVEGSSLTARISAALTDAKYMDAMILLAEMRIRKETPSLGALCRWVRVLDVISGLAIHVEPSTQTIDPRSSQNQELRQVLDAVLRVTGPTDTTALGAAAQPGTIALQPTWSLRDAKEPTRRTRASVEDESIFRACPAKLKEKFRIIETTPGAQRKPPNLHPAVLFASLDDTVLLENGPQTTVHKHPIVPNLRLIKDVLSPEECSSIIAAGETMEFIPDAPIRHDEDTSVLAHNFYWIVDQAFHDKLWDRVKAFVPESVTGRQVRGINRRFRVYRYVPGAEYRCHIDGAWPPSGIDPVTDAYQYDSSPADARQSSLFTFLIYLNDDFKGGETTFFIPSVQEGVMNAYPVKPIMGSVAVFPHGEAAGALLHEGTGVVEGAKYVIRTDVEYDVGATASARPDEPAAQGVKRSVIEE
ncbi:putative oxoglutarate/iron-dependent dioxygenase, prolyl 4-hydroxylase [Septoria linicola]|nr:putative oxoglutarate/iron-dependent dioxygenase, prolyl 4-hydroxylase [Septoria linicola]